MDMKNLKYQCIIDYKIYSSEVTVENRYTSYELIENVVLKAVQENNLICFTLINNGDKEVKLNKLMVELLTVSLRKDKFCILNPENLSKKIRHLNAYKIKSMKEVTSHLYEIFVDEENSNSSVLGFTGRHFSKNYIVNKATDKNLRIYAVYDFIEQKLEPKDEFVLDSIYIEQGRNIFTLFNNYIDSMTVEDNTNKQIQDTLNTRQVYGSILFTNALSDFFLKRDNKKLTLKVQGKRLYPIDISTEEGRKFIVNSLKEADNTNKINLIGIGAYISFVEKNKLFNVYKELHSLLDAIKENNPEACFFSDDCPLGIENHMVIINNHKIKLLASKCSLLRVFIRRKGDSHIDYDFFIKILLKRIIRFQNLELNINKQKLKELLQIIIGANKNSKLSLSELGEILEDLDLNCAISPYIENKNAFGFLIVGRKHVYVAAFNLQKKPIKFYCDFSINSNYRDLDGVATEVYSNTNYLISDGKLYIRSLPSMDCCLFKKNFEPNINIQ